ncbi:uncharacterized protein QC763_506470 [Podospora pseudopauciseta]|uniref:Heterokaryon incompatibility domain-containing protein n=1 Tax=Podospora pseudopauciseta TaxID=2093780 RepID=A0ABR0HA60_9PEZI|nr:hypothetical protein QC763_506470 [Podospora pseudopauciseta]
MAQITRAGSPGEVSDILPRSSTNTYQYSPFLKDAEKSSIRLIRLLPGYPSSPVVVELVTVPLDPGKIPYYEAVSYVWGTSYQQYEIACDGLSMAVSESALLALRRFRFVDHIRLLWIDQICINQQDDKEKSSQVMLMGEIYGTASQVLVYLGEADDTSDKAMDYISERCAQQEEWPRQFVVQVLSRPWFSRVWVLQEVALAHTSLVICGAKCVPWACFPEWWTRNELLLGPEVNPPPVLSYGLSVMKRLTLLQQLHNTRHSKATLALDKIYALLALLQPEDRIGVLVDYSLSTAEVYTSVAKSIIERTKSLAILSGKEEKPYVERERLPSWVPDWGTVPSAVSLGLANKYLDPFDAGGKPACRVNISIPLNGPPTLHCLGITFDTVKKLTLSTMRPGQDAATNNVEVLTDWLDLISGSSSSVVSETADYLIDQFNQNLRGVSSYSRSPPQPPKFAYSLWTTIQALSTPTLQLEPAELHARNNRGKPTSDTLKFCYERKLFLTHSGALGLGPPDLLQGDTVAVLLGAPVPHILRRIPSSEQNNSTNVYALVGECFVDGIMAGEALNHLQDQLKEMGHRCRTFAKSCSNAPLETFCIQ